MSTPQNGGQMKTKIDQDITSKQGIKKSISPLALGTHLKVFVDYVEARITAVSAAIASLGNSLMVLINGIDNRVTVLEEGQPISEDAGNVLEAREDGLYVPTPPEGGGDSVIRYTKDNTITEEHIGLLAMHKKTPIVTTDFTFELQDYVGLFVNNVSGSFSISDEIEQGGAIGTIIDIYDGGEGNFLYQISVTSGTFTAGTPITKSGASADVIATPSNSFSEDDEVTLFSSSDFSPIALATIVSINEGVFVLEIVSLIGDIEDADGILMVNEEDEISHYAIIDLETISYPVTSGGEDVATLCQTTPAEEGTKMEFDLKISGFVDIDIPTTRVISIDFNGDNIQEDQTIDITEVGEGSLSLPIVFKSTPTLSNHVEIGATLEDTLDNFQAWLSGSDVILNQVYKFHSRDLNNSISIEVMGGAAINASPYTLGSNDNLPYVGYRKEFELSGNLGDSGGGGYATYSVTRELANTAVANTIALTNILANIIQYNQTTPNQTVSFLKFGNIHSWAEGTPAEMGLVWFSTGEDFAAAVVAALELETAFSDNFEVVSSTWDGDEEEAVIRCRKLLSFNQNLNYSFQFTTLNNAANAITATTAVLPTVYIPKMVRSMVLGEIVAIDGSDVLIDKSMLHNVTLAGEGEGLSLNFCEPLSSDSILEELLAWDNGKVIMLGVLSDIVYESAETLIAARRKIARIGGVFLPLSTGNGNIEGKKVVKATRHTPYYTV